MPFKSKPNNKSRPNNGKFLCTLQPQCLTLQ